MCTTVQTNDAIVFRSLVFYFMQVVVRLKKVDIKTVE